MFSTYNMGHRLEAVVPANLASAYIDASQRYCGIEAKVIGDVRHRRGNTRLWIKSEHGTFRY
jgi:phosphoribosylaminoimidazole (AIR) synthetase